jgi:hypothetical protein
MNNNSLTFFGRYWKLALLFIASFFLSWTDFAFGVAGTLIYLPVLAFGAVLVALAVRHYFFRKSLDEDVHSGFFVAQWQKLDPRDRVIWNLLVMCVLFIGVCIIAAALIR